MAISGIHWPTFSGGNADNIADVLSRFEQTEWLKSSELEALQMSQLEELLHHATRKTPFYRDRLAVLKGLRRGKLTAEVFRTIPVLTRNDLQDPNNPLVSLSAPRDHGAWIDERSSGSTGRPVHIKTTAVSFVFRRAIRHRFHRWHQIDLTETGANMSEMFGPKKALAQLNQPVTDVASFALGPTYLFDVLTPIREQLLWLLAKKPAYLETYPSNLQALLDLSDEQGVRPEGLRLVTGFAEVFHQETKAQCMRQWQVPIADLYAAREVGAIAFQCPDAAHLHIQSENLYVEILDDDDAPCAPGEVGRVVVTDLHNFASPMIRYELGDYAEAGGACPCGRGLPVLRRIEGRIRNMITLPSGDLISPSLFPITFTEAAPSLRQWQAVQKTVNHMEFVLVVDAALSEDEQGALKNAFVACMGGFSPRITFRYVDDIPRSKSGKFETVKSELMK